MRLRGLHAQGQRIVGRRGREFGTEAFAVDAMTRNLHLNPLSLAVQRKAKLVRRTARVGDQAIEGGKIGESQRVRDVAIERQVAIHRHAVAHRPEHARVVLEVPEVVEAEDPARAFVPQAFARQVGTDRIAAPDPHRQQLDVCAAKPIEARPSSPTPNHNTGADSAKSATSRSSTRVKPVPVRCQPRTQIRALIGVCAARRSRRAARRTHASLSWIGVYRVWPCTVTGSSCTVTIGPVGDAATELASKPGWSWLPSTPTRA
jgi:hypothetical protein